MLLSVGLAVLELVKQYFTESTASSNVDSWTTSASSVTESKHQS
jgi:hypothetical protein